MHEYALVLVNLLSFFAGVVAIIAWYNTLVPLHRRAPWLVTRLPLVIALGLLGYGIGEGWLDHNGNFVGVALLVAGFCGASFVLSFLGAWALRSKLDEDERAHGHGRLSPALIAWSVALLVMLAVVGVNAAAFGVKSPFWIHVTGGA